MTLAFERMVAVMFPLRAKSLLGLRFTIISLMLIIGIYTIIDFVPEGITYCTFYYSLLLDE